MVTNFWLSQNRRAAGRRDPPPRGEPAGTTVLLAVSAVRRRRIYPPSPPLSAVSAVAAVIRCYRRLAAASARTRSAINMQGSRARKLAGPRLAWDHEKTGSRRLVCGLETPSVRARDA